MTACQSFETWAAENLPAGSVVGIDPYVHSVDEATALQAALTGAKKDLSMKALYGGENLVDGVWAEAGGRPERPRGLARARCRSMSPARPAPRS